MVKTNMKTILIAFISIAFINSTIILTENKKGEINGYFYELWYEDYNGKVKMSINENNFTCSWKNIDYVDFQYGKNIEPSKTLDELGNVTINYEAQINAEGDIMFGINGWAYMYESFNIIEYYNDEFVPPGTSLGTLFIDDGEYEIYYDEKPVQLNIHGINKAIIFSSVRKEKRLKGTINFNKHFQSWKKKGCKFEYISRLSLLIDGNKSKGNAIVNQIAINYKQK